MQSNFFTIQLLIVINLISFTKASLTQIELRAKYGQVGTSFHDGKSCYRTCDGKVKTCYFEFHAQMYSTMNGQCGVCALGILGDCFKNGCIPANGVERVLMTVNQQFPGPEINVCRGDRIIVDVTNHMAGQGLTIHWHGIHQVKTPWYDGVPMVTQCPINTGNTFRYEFYASERGTHIWHAHSGLHRSNGLVGPLIVRESNDPNADSYDYDLAQHTLLLLDWDNQLAEDREPGLRSVLTLPNSVLINGFGSYDHKFSPMAVFYVQRGKKHRFRIINAVSHICQLEITIKDHNLTVIATDGYPVEPFFTERLTSSPGERFDIVMDAINDPNITETILTVRTCGTCILARVQEFARIIFVDDILNHSKKIEDHQPLLMRPPYETLKHLLFGPKLKLNDPFTNCLTPNCNCVAVLQQKNLTNSIGTNLRNVEPFKTIQLHFKMDSIEKRPYDYLDIFSVAKVATINRIANAPSSIPGLTQDDSNIEYCNANSLPDKCDIAKDNRTIYHCPHLIPLELDKVYEFLLIDDTNDELVSHPIHMHGYGFQIIDMGTLKQLETGETPFATVTHPPVMKDTVTIPKHGFVRIRFRTSNPGYWLLHCHIEFHQNPGMVVILKVGDQKDLRPPPLNFPTCGNYLAPIDV